MTVALVKVDEAVQTLVSKRLAPSIRVESIDGAVHLMHGLRERALELDAVVLGSELEEPIQLAQSIRYLTEDIPVMILTVAEGYQKLRHALQFSPFLGPDVTPWPTHQLAELPRALEDSISRRKRRVWYRSAIGAAQNRLRQLGFQPPQVTHYLDRILDAAPIGVVHVDRTGRCLALNRYAGRILRVHEREALGVSVLRWFPDQHQEELQRLLETSQGHTRVEQPTPVVFELLSDQGRQFVEIAASPLADRHGRAGAIFLLRDVTDLMVAERERQEAVDALRQSEQRYRDLVEMMEEAVVLTGPDGTIRFANARFRDMLGYTEAQIAGRNLLDFASREHAPLVREHLERALQAQSHRFEAAWISKTGEAVYTSTAPKQLPGAYAGETTLLSVLTDITERRRAEEALAKNEHQLRLITNAVPVLIGYIDADQHLVFANRMFEEWFPRRPGGGSSPHIAALIGDEVYAAIERELRLGLKGEAGDVEAAVRCGGDYPRYLRWSVVPDVSDEGVRGLFLLASDLTDWKRVEERDRQQLVELCHAARLTMLGEMSSQLSHELAQPLAAIEAYSKGCMKLVESHEIAVPDLSDSLSDIWKQATRASEIMNRLRSFARKEVARSLVQINDVVRSVLRLAQVDSRCNDAPTHLQLSEDVPPTAVDKTLIEQVVLNMVLNAVEAMEGLPREQRRMAIKTYQDDGYVHVVVADSGPGLSPEVMARIFEPFFTTKQEGMGMGLSLSRSIIHAHGGRLWAENDPGGGARLEFTLPLHLSDEDKRVSYDYRPDSVHP